MPVNRTDRGHEVGRGNHSGEGAAMDVRIDHGDVD